MSLALAVLKTSKLSTFPLEIVCMSLVLDKATLGTNIPLSWATTSSCAEPSGIGVPIPTWALT